MTPDDRPSRNPLRFFFDFNRRELPVVLLMFAFFFIVIAVFQITKPLKNGLFIDRFGAYLELYAKIGNIVTAAVAMMVFTVLFNKLQRTLLLDVFSAFFAVSFIALIFLLRQPQTLSIWAFYLLGDLLSTLMVAAFWAYLTDLSNPDQAGRLYGAIGTGGVLGGWIGSAVAKILLDRIGMSGLLWMSGILMLLLIVITHLVERLAGTSRMFRTQNERRQVARPVPSTSSSWKEAFEGARLTLRSPYLAAILGIMAFYEFGMQLTDYQFKKATESLAGVTATQDFMANVYFYGNFLSVVVQLFIVTWVMRKWGPKVGLLILPFTLIGASIHYILTPTLFAASLLMVFDNGLNYSIHQTSREALYVPTSAEDKYKSRAFTNMFMQRFAKGMGTLSVIGLLTLNLSLVQITFGRIVVLILMIWLGIYAGRRFEQMTQQPQRQ